MSTFFRQIPFQGNEYSKITLNSQVNIFIGNDHCTFVLGLGGSLTMAIRPIMNVIFTLMYAYNGVALKRYTLILPVQ